MLKNVKRKIERHGQRTFVLFSLLLFSTVHVSASVDDSLDIKIGQMLMVGFRGMSMDASSTIVQDIARRKIGGVILFDYDVPSKTAVRNIQSSRQVKTLCTRLQSYAAIPLFIAIDQEGGKISRLKEKYDFERSVSPQYLGTVNNEDTTRFYARRTTNELTMLGINMNMAPVVDVNVNKDNPVIAKLERSYSSDPQRVSKHARWTLEEFQKKKIIGVAKHFPGHGSSRGDSHLGLTDVTDTYMHDELRPYADLISSGVISCIMTAHIFHSRMDAEYPATLSSKIISRLLRDSLGFHGVVISDDMQMKAIADHYGLDRAIVRAITAGVDVLVFANNSVYDDAVAEKAIGIIHDAIQKGEISEHRIDESFRRIMQLKNWMMQ